MTYQNILEAKINYGDMKMSTITVRTKEELETAVKNNTDKIIITGDVAQKIISGQKKK